MFEAITIGDARVVPVHHADTGGKPEQEDHAKRDPEPAVHEDQGTLEEGRQRGEHRSDTTAGRDRRQLKKS